MWAAVSQAWEHLWQLGSGLAVRAISQLHSHLLCQSLLHHTIQNAKQTEVHDATLPLVTLLATKTRTLSLVQVGPQLSRLRPTLDAFVCPKNLPLQELVLTGIDMGSQFDFLICLLRCCKSLSVLKLGGNCSVAVLEAARECPLTVLHVSERMAWQPRIQESDLVRILIGCEGTLTDILHTICQEKQTIFRPFWPDLIDVSTGWCRVSSEFLLLVLLAFPRLQHLRSQLIDTSITVKRYVELVRQVPSLHNLCLKTNVVVYSNFTKTYRHLPNATTLTIFNITDVERLLWELVEASRDLPYVHALNLALGPGPTPQQSRFPSREQFAPLGGRIIELHIEVHHDDGWVFAMLSLFQSVQRVRITASALHIPRETDPVVVFPSVSKLECVCHDSPRLLLFLAASFPNLESMTLKSRCGSLVLPWEHIREMAKLRDLKLLGNHVDNISGLCCVPRDTSGGTHWTLCVRPLSVTPHDLARLQWCGWTYYYVKEYP